MADQNMPNDAGGPSVERKKPLDRDEVVNRKGSTSTPRRYDQPLEEDEDPVIR